jgi:hypothetical protein
MELPEPHYRKAKNWDFDDIRFFVDYWLSGRGKRYGAENVVNDYFLSHSQIMRYIKKYTTWLCYIDTMLVGWAVIHPNGTLYHFLISGQFRGYGIGTKFLTHINPRVIRSKSDQSTGDPSPFYERLGYHHVGTYQPRRRIDIDKLNPNRPKTVKLYEAS